MILLVIRVFNFWEIFLEFPTNDYTQIKEKMIEQPIVEICGWQRQALVKATLPKRMVILQFSLPL
jgi:hypothetical protein